ncbi:hypothetical protein RGR602_PC00176 (plasmid) [Rhizobium gallicum bv. gallicum R602sp]|uniref:Uncharacterized protein n=1 Tax=Rhizobium gallicum bv. gallicum R602sp TaxID=1041138 RepID=A0A0B4XCB1_9HYPH|nr:hypothetical protein [Rhizobium gallicum]AJD44223.1 hypothetical protein RGR602_PC00176 [Rhizobium gallicum bv. gallicum R602sp]TDW25585.1 hypothetical protein EV128_11715 [Rhizobium azibense]
MSDLVKELLHLSDDPAISHRESRRQLIDRFVHALTEMTTVFVSDDDRQPPIPVMRLIAMIEGMTSSIADADDTTFSAIVEELALLLRTLERHRQEMARFTVH